MQDCMWSWWLFMVANVFKEYNQQPSLSFVAYQKKKRNFWEPSSSKYVLIQLTFWCVWACRKFLRTISAESFLYKTLLQSTFQSNGRNLEDSSSPISMPIMIEIVHNDSRRKAISGTSNKMASAIDTEEKGQERRISLQERHITNTQGTYLPEL